MDDVQPTIVWRDVIEKSAFEIRKRQHFVVEKINKHPLPSARQHPSYGDCLEDKREYYQNSSVLDCVTQCSQSAAHLYFCCICRKIVSKPIEHLKTKLGSLDSISINSAVQIII